MVIKPFLLLGLPAVYDTHRRTTLTAPETTSRSRDMVGAHHNLNGSRDLTTPFAGWFTIGGLALANVKSLSPLTRRYERRYKMLKMGWHGVIRVTKGH